MVGGFAPCLLPRREGDRFLASLPHRPGFPRTTCTPDKSAAAPPETGSFPLAGDVRPTEPNGDAQSLHAGRPSPPGKLAGDPRPRPKARGIGGGSAEPFRGAAHGADRVATATGNGAVLRRALPLPPARGALPSKSPGFGERRFSTPPEVRRAEMAHHAKFLARTVMVPGGDVELAYRVLTRVLTMDGVIDHVKRKRYYEKPCQKRRREAYEACRRIYNSEMGKKINFLMRKSRPDPWLGC